jgi:hypothetical protein
MANIERQVTSGRLTNIGRQVMSDTLLTSDVGRSLPLVD